jgi:hypothetical protein
MFKRKRNGKVFSFTFFIWIVVQILLLYPFKILDLKMVYFFIPIGFLACRLNLLCQLLFNQLLAVEFNFKPNANSLCRGNLQVNSFFIFFWYPIQIFLKYICFFAVKYFMRNSIRDCCQVVNGKTKRIFTKKTLTNFLAFQKLSLELMVVTLNRKF